MINFVLCNIFEQIWYSEFILRTYCPNIYTVVLLLLPPKKFAIRPKFGLSSDAPLFSIGFVD